MRTLGDKIKRLVCAEHCRFYKPWTPEVEPCAAYQWLTSDRASGAQVLDALEKLRGRRPIAVEEIDGALRRSVCANCSHYATGCRYRSQKEAGQAAPCGGLAVLRTLLEQKRVSLEDFYSARRIRDELAPTAPSKSS